MFTHSLFCIRNLTRSLRSLVRFLICHNSCVNTVRAHFACSILYLLTSVGVLKEILGRKHFNFSVLVSRVVVSLPQCASKFYDQNFYLAVKMRTDNNFNSYLVLFCGILSRSDFSKLFLRLVSSALG